MSDNGTFPKDFLWGVSTSAYQVEEGDPENQWVAWERSGGIKSGDQRGLACEWWGNAERDFDLARELGLNALRLSIEWSRIEPRPGEWYAPAIQRYREMLQALVERGLRPIITLHHFTHPIWFEERGGFLARDAADSFCRFANRAVEELGDLCQDWVTINEPNVYSSMSFLVGDFPPGRKGALIPALQSLGNMARAHARAYRAIHAVQPKARVGWAQNYLVFAPANPASRTDQMLCRLMDRLYNRTFLNLIQRGHSGALLRMLSGDLSEVRDSCDFVGVNVYSRTHVGFHRHSPEHLFVRPVVPDNVPQGDQATDWPYGEAYPEAIRLAVEEVAQLGRPVLILENGLPDAQDRLRPAFLLAVLDQVQQLLKRNIPVQGYFHWTLADNFEWSEGWRLRFGLYELEPETQRRTKRSSAEVYSAVVKSNGIPEALHLRFPWPGNR